jgi:hypothetical protein
VEWSKWKKTDEVRKRMEKEINRWGRNEKEKLDKGEEREEERRWKVQKERAGYS